jgi:tetratricopeptide (TPR) repeat protein
MRKSPERALVVLGVVGFLGGALLALAVVGAITYGRYSQVAEAVSLTTTAAYITPTPTPTRTLTATPTATLSLSPTATSTKPPTQTPTPTGDPQLALQRAEALLGSGANPQQVVDTLTPALDLLTDPADMARAQSLLGGAEYQLGNYRQAASHLEQAYALVPDVNTLVSLANAYDRGGDLNQALKWYIELGDYSGAAANPWRQTAWARATAIATVIGTPTPNT